LPQQNEKQIKFEECLIPFSSESFIFPSLTKNIKIKMHKTVIVHVTVVFSHTKIRTEIRVFENRVLRRIFGHGRASNKVGENCTISTNVFKGSL
jgi:hypothetical protein